MISSFQGKLEPFLSIRTVIKVWSCLILLVNIALTGVFVFPAMSSYLYIVKYELPIVIQAFLGNSNGWVARYLHSSSQTQMRAFPGVTINQISTKNSFIIDKNMLLGWGSKYYPVLDKSVLLNDVHTRSRRCFNGEQRHEVAIWKNRPMATCWGEVC